LLNNSVNIPRKHLIVAKIIFIKKLYLNAFRGTISYNVEKKQLIVLFSQITVDNGYLSDYYGCVVTRESSKRLLRKTLAINIF